MTGHPRRRRSATPEDLAQIHWLQRLAPEDRAWAAARVQVHDLAPHDVLCVFGDQPTHWYGTLHGLLKLSNDSRDGLPITYAGLPTSGWFGEGTLIKLEPYRYNVSALRASTVGSLPVADFHHLLDVSLEFNRFLMAQINERLGQFMAARVTDRMRNPEIRVARSLLALFNPVLYPTVDAFFQITQQELAYLIGIPRQRINEALQQLAVKGVVELGYGGVRVLDTGLLSAVAAAPLR
ncbi:Crp/Fnr family transcriptional regulator [Hydrogenophaga sp. Root209]|uniref:Crp/Fnr family transcriptional regulator n=1 Tax=unclassified Hydrogenophaga TaxID=2610897 RepID=UPI0006F6B4B1|nr:Crp/Fnr family transcriptional regulator [Hydrogenophaga sp. Root209]KRB98739.1 Crp/Fnr family transcriptional regulator [Hydrogenophaga sp. Root209]